MRGRCVTDVAEAVRARHVSGVGRRVQQRLGAARKYGDVASAHHFAELERVGEIVVWDSSFGHKVLSIRHFQRHQHVHPNEAESEYQDEFDAIFTLGIP